MTPEKELSGFLAKYAPEIASFARTARAKMQGRFPGAHELVYDNYNALVIGYGPTEHASDALFSLALYPRWVTLFFLAGAKLKDPHKLLQGSGKVVRNVRLSDPKDLDKPEIVALFDQALQLAAVPLPASGGRLIIKSVSAKQRPRKPK